MIAELSPNREYRTGLLDTRATVRWSENRQPGNGYTRPVIARRSRRGTSPAINVLSSTAASTSAAAIAGSRATGHHAAPGRCGGAPCRPGPQAGR